MVKLKTYFAALLLLLYPLATFAYDDFPSIKDEWWQKGDDPSWSNTHDATASNYFDNSSNTLVIAQEFLHADTNYRLSRSALKFDTSSLPDDAIIDSAELMLYNVYRGAAPYDSDSYVTIVGFTPNDPSTWDANDFDYSEWGTTHLTDDLDYNDITVNAYNSFTMNTAGKSYIDPTGPTFLGMRGGHDIANAAPSTTDLEMQFSTVESANDPILRITWHSPSSSSSSSSSSATGSGGILGSGSLLLFHSYCNQFAGTGSSATCTQADTSIEIPAIHAILKQNTTVHISLLIQVFRWLLMALLLFLSARWMFQIVTHKRPRYSRYRR